MSAATIEAAPDSGKRSDKPWSYFEAVEFGLNLLRLAELGERNDVDAKIEAAERRARNETVVALSAFLREELLTLPSEARTSHKADLTAREAATILNCVKPDGTPRNSFYTNIAPHLGGYRLHGQWRFPPSGVEAYKRNGGTPSKFGREAL